MRTIEANHLTAQQQASRTPYFHLVFYSPDFIAQDTWYFEAYAENSEGEGVASSEGSFQTTGQGTQVDFSTDSGEYPNRILMIDYTEEPYNDYAYILLRNNDRALPSVLGYHTLLGMGDTYLGANYYKEYPCLWVKEERLISAPGKIYTLLVLGGIWSMFAEQKVIGSLNPGDGLIKHIYDPEADDMVVFNNKTIYGCLQNVVDKVGDACDWAFALSAIDAGDTIINTYIPGDEINLIPAESALEMIQNLLGLTLTFARLEGYNTINLKCPVDSDAVDKTYYSYTAPYFIDYTSNDPLLIPNTYYVVMGYNEKKQKWPSEAEVIATMGFAQDEEAVAEYMVVADVHVAGYIQSKTDADNRASVLLARTRAQLVYGQITMPHDAQLELYDKIELIDARGIV